MPSRTNYDKEKPAAGLEKRVESLPPPHHEYAELFPLMGDDDLAELTTSIRVEGLREKVTLFEGKVLDGRNRLAACLEAGVKPDYVDLPEGDDPLQYVLAKNLHRRHLTIGQRAILAEELATGSHGGDRKTARGQVANLRLADVAKLTGCSERAVSMVRELVAAEQEDLVDRVRAGELSLNAAMTLFESQVRTDPEEDSSEELEETAEDKRAAKRRAQKARDSRAGRSREDKEDAKLRRLFDLAMKGDPKLEGFRKALSRFQTKKGEPKIGHFRQLVTMLTHHIERVQSAKEMVEKYAGISST